VRVVLAYEDKMEERLLENMSTTDKGQDLGTHDYQRLIAELYQKGYSLKSTFSQSEGRFTTLVFVKGQ
jgi:hypothetical protein